MFVKHIVIILLFSIITTSTMAAEQTPYSPAKVVYDVSSADAVAVNHILDRVSLLQNMYDNNPFEASIIIVVHEGAIPLFSKSQIHEHRDLVRRANSLTMGDIIQFRICSASAKMQGFTQKDFPDFVKMVPMADAEIVMLQHNGYAYLR
ncbi:DsrE family protein [Kaarinaea lacus]